MSDNSDSAESEQGGCCCNCKIQLPEVGKTPLQITIFVITLILFILTWIEIVALGSYVEVFETATVESCCGLITEKSVGTTTVDGAVCFENDFPSNGPPFDIININGSRICSVNDVICDKYSDPTTGQQMTLNQCMQSSIAVSNNYKLSDICSNDVLIAEDTAAISQTACILAILNSIILFCVGCCDFFGCFRDSNYCQNKCVSVFNKILEVFIWIVFLFVITVFIENVVSNGYQTESLTNEAYKYAEDECIPDPNGGATAIIWSDFELKNVPEWLQSNWYSWISYIGLALSLMEFFMFFYLTCCSSSCGGNENEQEMTENVKKQTETTIEMQQNA